MDQQKVIVFWHLAGNASVRRTVVDTSFGLERGLDEDETIRRAISIRYGCEPDDMVIDEIFRTP